MLTRAGRVVLMDFGIAKAVARGRHGRGHAGLLAAGAGGGAPRRTRGPTSSRRASCWRRWWRRGARGSAEARQALWQALREDPPRGARHALGGGDPQGGRAGARASATPRRRRWPARSRRSPTASPGSRRRSRTRASPSFTEADAEYFFGREAEVEAVWKRLPQRHLLALVGPSGRGQEQLPAGGADPGEARGLGAPRSARPATRRSSRSAQALVPEVARRHRRHAADAALRGRRRRGGRSSAAGGATTREALVVVDQFEELFTLNPPEVQARFAALLSPARARGRRPRAAVDAGRLPPPLPGARGAAAGLRATSCRSGRPTGDALRRALVQPALKCGYRFEDEALVAEMLHAVRGGARARCRCSPSPPPRCGSGATASRGCSPARRTTRSAASPARWRSTPRRRSSGSGTDRLPLVRELFRNLVTAAGHPRRARRRRAAHGLPRGPARRRRGGAQGAVDARLLTSLRGARHRAAGSAPAGGSRSCTSRCSRRGRGWCAGAPRTRAAAQLRDQLRQAAHLWEEKGKPEDLLWTGTSYQEYQVWRARYPGGLSEAEETFARAMAARAGAAGAGAADGRRGVVLAAVVAGGGSRSASLLCEEPSREAEAPARGGAAPRPRPAEARRPPERRARLRDRQPRARRQRPGAPLRRRGALAGPAGALPRGPGRPLPVLAGAPTAAGWRCRRAPAWRSGRGTPTSGAC